jgi:hypothetical protein
MSYKRYPAATNKKVSQISSARNPKMDRAELHSLINMVTDLVGKNPDKAAIILSDWLDRPGQKKKTKKSA